MSNSNDPGHGNSVAAWTTVIVIMLAFATGTLFYWFNQPELVYASAGLAVFGVVLGWILRKLGYGVSGSKTKSN